MVELQKILVVDDGERGSHSALSAELAELGYASVTASVDAADEVLTLIPSPSAIVLQLPRRTDQAARRGFLELARRLRATRVAGAVPVLVVDPDRRGGGIASILQTRMRVAAAAKPEL